jgi:hypothetical protein
MFCQWQRAFDLEWISIADSVVKYAEMVPRIPLWNNAILIHTPVAHVFIV